MEENKEKKYELYKFIADKGQKPLRIDKFLVDRIENISRTKIQKAAEQGYLIVNDTEVKSNYKVKPGDIIQLMTFYKPEKIEIIPENIPIEIIFEDEYFLIINKPVGLVVHPAYGNESGTLVNALMYYLKDLPMFKTGEIRAGLVHRLDKNTSGVMVIAKDDQTLSEISKQFYNRIPEKKYIAMVWGAPKQQEGTITGHIGRSLKDRKKMNVFPGGEFGKHAVTHYKVIKDLSYVSLTECVLETGRTHQIRAHMKYLGHPIFGDVEYGGAEILRGTRYTKYKQFVQNCFKIMPAQALHAASLEFNHPVTNERVIFEAELPKNFKELINKWEQYLINRIV
ncbi:MAG: RluA family pseudouridine synthase [Bacteroidales bacterium]|nr:RluA family pseudouridine synthase [Bacteroidales bacterium]